MKILITGCNGFIGSHLVDKIKDVPTYNILGIDNYELTSPDFPFINSDIVESSKIFEKFKPECVIHLASRVGSRLSVNYPNKFYFNNIIGTNNIIEKCIKHKVEKLIFSSSSGVYQTSINRLTETSPIKPSNPNEITKITGEYMCDMASGRGLNSIILRISTTYGSGLRMEMGIPTFVDSIYKGKTITMYDGSSMRDFLYIDDCVQGIIKAIDFPVGGCLTFNIGTGIATSIKDVILLISKIIGKEAIIEEKERKYGDTSSNALDISEAVNFLNYRPLYSLEEGLSEFIYWYKKNYL